ncbi:MAG TPA: HAD family phosphatase [Casimicrobiaceae bacterium]|nr:HAD family phosphatase [Casimicrobiaceae bacterium]
MMRTLPHAVIFDMDGLMLDTEPLAARAWSEAANELGLAFDDSICAHLIGRNFADCRVLIRERHGESYPIDALMRRWHATYDAIVAREGIELKTGLLELLDWLEARRIPKAVATSTRRSRAIAKLVHTSLLERFATLVGGDEVVNGKPEPDIFLEAAARIHAAPEACVVLEDSMPGVRAALAGGMATIMVPDLPSPPDAPLPDTVMVMPSLHEVRRHFAALAA